MESKTPRTDKFLKNTRSLPGAEWGEKAREFMCQLETELAEARAEIERKDKLIEQMREALENALKDMDRIDEVCKLAGVHAFTLMRKELEAALAAERGE